MLPRTSMFWSQRPMSVSASTVLPEPLAPTTAKISPTWTLSERSRRTSLRTRPARQKGAFGSYMVKETLSPSTLRR